MKASSPLKWFPAPLKQESHLHINAGAYSFQQELSHCDSTAHLSLTRNEIIISLSVISWILVGRRFITENVSSKYWLKCSTAIEIGENTFQPKNLYINMWGLQYDEVMQIKWMTSGLLFFYCSNLNIKILIHALAWSCGGDVWSCLSYMHLSVWADSS